MSKRLLAELQSRVNSQMNVIDALRDENQRLRDGTEVVELRQLIRNLNEKLRCEKLGIQVQASIPKDMLRRMKQLAHPDKHGNSELSNTVMKFLNSL
jgi:hypothetical protein